MKHNSGGLGRYMLVLMALLTCYVGAEGQSVSDIWGALLKSREAHILQSPVGVLEGLKPVFKGGMDLDLRTEEAKYLDALARGRLEAGDAELRLLRFIEQHPHSSYIHHARTALGDLYYSRGDYSSAIYWLGQVETALLPEAMGAGVEYHMAYALMREGQEDRALQLLLPLTYYQGFSNDASFYAGYLLLKKGELKRGVKLLEKVEADAMYGAYASAFIAESELSELRYSDALGRAQRLLDRGALPKEVEASLLRTAGLASSSQGAVRSSVEYLERYMKLEQQPGRLEALVLGQGLWELGRYGEAERCLLSVPSEQPDFMGQLALYYAGLSQLAQQERSRAVATLDRAAAMAVYAPITEVSRYNSALAVYAATPGRVSLGTKRLADFLTAYPNSEYRGEVIKHLSDAYLLEPNVSVALKELNSISSLPKELVRLRDRVRLREANTSLGKGDTELATKQYDSIIASSEDPMSVAEAYLWKGEAAYRAENYRVAIQSTEEYLKRCGSTIVPNHNAYYTLGYAYYNLGQYARAEQYFRQYEQANTAPSPDERTALYNRLGDIALQRKAYDQAASLYTRAEEAGGAEADYALFNKAMVKGLSGAYADKASYMNNVVLRYPNSKLVAESMYEQGRALEMLGDKQGAERAYERFFTRFRAHPIAPKVGLQLALTYYAENKLPRAMEVYEMVVRQYPSSPEAKSALQDLKSISVQMNQVDSYKKLLQQVGKESLSSSREMDSLTYLAAERLVAKGAPREAEQALDAYLVEYPSGAFVDQVYYNKALLQYNAKNYRGAVEVLAERVLHFSDQLAEDSYRVLASSYDRLQDAGHAAEAYYKLAILVRDKQERGKWLGISAERAEASKSVDFLASLANQVLTGQIAVEQKVQAQVLLSATKTLARENRKSDAVASARKLKALPDFGGHTIAEIVLALDLYDKGDYKTVQSKMKSMTQVGTTDAYWLARAFILLSDSYAKLGDADMAKAYLESVKNSYTNSSDGILQMIDERLKRL